jgi:flagellar basal body-associated protein FliL
MNKKGDTNTMWIIIGAVLALVVLTVSIIILYGGLKTPSKSISDTNNKLGGTATKCLENDCDIDNIFKNNIGFLLPAIALRRKIKKNCEI